MKKENTGLGAGQRIQLRKAAGIYWLIDMEQGGIPYRKPIPVNDTGAKIWSLWEMGKNEDEISGELAVCYGISREEAGEDVKAFLAMVNEHLQGGA